MTVLAFVIVLFPRKAQPRKFLWSKVEKSFSKLGGIDSKLQNLIRPYIILTEIEDQKNFSFALFMLCALTVSSNLKNSSTRFLSSLIGSEFSYSPVFGEIAKMQCNKLQSSPIPYFHFTAINIFILQRFLHAIYYLHRYANKQQIVFYRLLLLLLTTSLEDLTIETPLYNIRS